MNNKNNNIPAIDVQFQKMLLIEAEWRDFLENGLFESEVEELEKALNILEMNSWSVIQFIVKNSAKMFDFLNNINLSVEALQKFHEEFEKSNFEITANNREAFRILGVYMDKFSCYLFSKEDNKNYQLFADLKNKKTLIDTRFNSAPQIIKSIDKPKGVRVFKLRERYKSYNLSILNAKLKQTKKFVAEDTTLESLEMVFGIKKVSKKFKKINWIGSILELKYFITFLMKAIVHNDPNFKFVICDCFLIKDSEIKESQIKSPSGSNRNFKDLEDIINQIAK